MAQRPTSTLAGKALASLATLALTVTGLTLLPPASQATESSAFPSQPLQLVAPFPAGAATDYAARLIGQNLADILAVPVVVENKTGAGGTIAADAVAKANPDGHQMLIGTVSLTTQPELTQRPVYFPDHLQPLGVAVDMLLVVVANTDLAANDLPGLLKLAASRPDGLSAGSAGQGTLSHLGWEIVRKETGITVQHIPYRGSAPAMTDLVAGHTDVMIDTLTSALPHLASGKVKALATLTPNRLAQLPDTQTAAEQGYPWLTMSAWNAFMVPAGTPPDRIAKLHDALRQAAERPDVTASLEARGLKPVVRTPAAHQAFVLQEQQRWTDLIRAAGITP